MSKSIVGPSRSSPADRGKSPDPSGADSLATRRVPLVEAPRARNISSQQRDGKTPAPLQP